MDFLDNYILPQSAHHMVLLRYLLILTLVILLPYLSFVTGSGIISLFLRRKGPEAGGGKYYRLARDFADLAAYNKSLALSLGVIPMLSVVFCYAQLLHLSSSQVPGYLLLSMILYLIAIGLLSVYKHSFHFTDLFTYLGSEEIKSEEYKKEIAEYKSSMSNTFKSTGFYGILFLLVSVYVFIGATQLASQTDKVTDSNNFLLLLFSFDTISYFVLFLFLSLAVASTILLYVYFRPKSDKKSHLTEDYLNYVRRFTLTTGLVSILAVPFFIVVNILTKSEVALSGGIFAAVMVVLLVLLLMSNFYYFMIKNDNAKHITSVSFLLVIFFIFFVIKDQAAFNAATKDNYYKLVQNYEVHNAEFLAQFGKGGAEISGEDIFKGRCVACHSFEQKITGPAYNDVLPKYNGDVDKLAGFIVNPVKVNPDFPAMPNQGLKPAEAKAVAEYLVKTYEENHQ